MPAKRRQNTKQQKAAYSERLRESDDVRDSAFRKLNAFFQFRVSCGNHQCRRVRGCAGDPMACFHKFWPLLPEEARICLRVSVKGSAAGLSPREIEAEYQRALAYYREEEAAGKAAPPVPASAPASAAPSPRLRVL